MLSRRGWFFVVSMVGGLFAPTFAETVDADSVVQYILSSRKSDGAFGPADQRYSGQAWTCPAVMTLRLLGQPVDKLEGCLFAPQEYRAAHPYQAHFEKLMVEEAFGAALSFPVGRQKPPVSFVFLPPNDPRNPAVFHLSPNEISYTDLESLYFALSAVMACDRRIAGRPALINFVRSSQSPAGHFYGHIASTAHAVGIHAALKATLPLERPCILWLRSCQTAVGGFRFSPEDPSPANRPDIRYTFYALRALADLNTKPAHPQDCIQWINSLQNADGGFGDQTGLPSRLASTYWAVQSLQILTGNARSAIQIKSISSPQPQSSPAGLSLYQACLAIPLPACDDLDRLGDSGVHLAAVLGPATPLQHDRIFRLNAAARSQSLPLSLIARIEWSVSKLRFIDHTIADHHDICLLNPVVSEDDWKRLSSLLPADSSSFPWSDYASKVLIPLGQFPAFVFPENDFSPMLTYRLFDESMAAPVSYSAILGNDTAGRDSVGQDPGLERWIGRLPFVPAGPVHGNLDEWFNDPVQVRVLFWAKGFQLSDFLIATQNGLSVCVIRDPESAEGVVYYGRPDLVELLKLRLNDWQWWKHKTDPIPILKGETHG